MMTGKELDTLEFKEIRGLDGIKELTLDIEGTILNIAVVNGVGNVDTILDQIDNGTCKYHFIEVMACPGGCINGGGQPIHQKADKVIKRIQALYSIDRNMINRKSHENESVKTLYKEFLGEPNGHKAHEILHTSYKSRKNIK